MMKRRSITRWLSTCTIVPLLAIVLASLLTAQTLAATKYTVYNSPADGTPGDIDGSEIIDITPDGTYALVVGTRDLSERRVYIATLSPATGIVINRIDLDAAVAGRGLISPVPSSVAVHPSGRFALVTIREGSTASNTASEQPGLGVFVEIGPNGALSLVTNPVLTLGIRPESVDIASNGEFAIVANEGSNGIPNSGTLSIIDLDPSGTATGSVAHTLPTNADPESVAIAPNNARAFATLETTGDIAIVDVPSQINNATVTIVDVPGSSGFSPDGVAVLPDSQYILTANEATNRVIMFRINDTGPSVTFVADSGTALPAGSTPEMIAIGLVDGQLRAFVTLEDAAAVAAFTLNPAANGNEKLQLETLISLNRDGQPTADSPEGIAVANGGDKIVTANALSNNISIIVAQRDLPPLTKQMWLPIARN
jgi:DNA-binding beta-propeller fold protein YncE